MSQNNRIQQITSLLEALDQRISDLDRPETRKPVADLFFRKAYLLLTLRKLGGDTAPDLKDIGEALYQAALRYYMVGADGLLVALLQFVRQNDLENTHPKLKWQVERILNQKPELLTLPPESLPFETESMDITIAMDVDVERLEQDFKIQAKVEKIKEALKDIATKEENNAITKLEAANEYEKLFDEVISVLSREKTKSKDVIELARDIGNKCLLRSLVMQDFSIAARVLEKATTYQIPLHLHYRMKIEKVLGILEIFRSRQRMVLWLPLEDMPKDVSIDEQILAVMERGYPLNIEENVDIEVVEMFRVDLLRGVSNIPVEKVIGDLPRLTPTSVILNLHDFFPDELIIVFYKIKDTDGLMVVPTGEIERLHVVHLEA